MNDFKEKLEQRIVQLKQVIGMKEEELACAPEGMLNVAKSGSRIQYYYKNNSGDIKTYLKCSEQSRIKALCQKDYDQKVLSIARKELNQLERLKSRYPKQTYEDIYGTLNSCRKTMVHPVSLSDEEYIKAWEQEDYQRKGFQEDAPEYYTDKGERVRSKTEILIANALFRNCIPYKYEKPLFLKEYGKIHPDFTVLNVRLRKEFYWEHLGMMDDPKYLEEALQRIAAYEKNNLITGSRLILTFETLKRPINSLSIDKMIKEYLK